MSGKLYSFTRMSHDEIDRMMKHYRKVIKRKPYKVKELDWEEYKQLSKEAQKNADETGCDWGLEKNELFGTFRIFPLPRKRIRSGHELRCEVLECTNYARQQPGHGSKPDDDCGPAGEEGWITDEEKIRMSGLRSPDNFGDDLKKRWKDR